MAKRKEDADIPDDAAEATPEEPATPEPTTPDAAAPAPPVEQVPSVWATEVAAWKRATTLKLHAWKPILALTVVALALRYFQLGEPNLWIDEIWLRQDAIAGTNINVAPVHRFHLGPVGAMVRLLGDTAFGLRAWSALLAALAVPACAVTGLIARGPRLAIVLGLLALFSPYATVYAQDANYYGGMLFYATIQMAWVVMFFAGASISAPLIVAGVGYLAFYTHPFSAVGTAVAMGAMLIGSLTHGATRRALYATAPPEWPRRPHAPLLVLGIVGGGAVAWTHRADLLAKAAANLELGGTFTNIRFGYAFFADVWTSFGVAFFRPWGPAELLALVPLAAFLVGVVALFRASRDDAPCAGLAWLAVLGPLATFALIFNMQVTRNFNLRYITYLLPWCQAATAMGLVSIAERYFADRLRPTWKWSFAALPVLAIQLPYLVGYYATDGRNFIRLAEDLAAERKPGDAIWLTVPNQNPQVDFYFPPAGLPSSATLASQNMGPKGGTLLANALKWYLYGRENVWVVDAWSHDPDPALYAFRDEALGRYRSYRSFQGAYQDAKLYHWTAGTRMLLPGAQTRMTVGTSDEDRTVAVAAAGQWEVTFGSESLDVEADGPKRLTLPDSAAGQEVVATPVLTTRWVPAIDDQPAFPAHSLDRVESLESGDAVVWRERDGIDEHVVYQPDGPPRQLVLRAVRRMKEDLEIGRPENQTVAAPQLLLCVLVDGTLRGIWPVELGTGIQRIPTGLELEPGNHRISVLGTLPRLDGKPYNPWRFGGIEWNSDREAATPNLMEQMTFSGLLGEPLPFGAKGSVAGGWRRMQGTQDLHLDEAVVGPSGQASLRVDFPKDPTGAFLVVSPPVPVKPGTFFAYQTAIRCEGMTRREALVYRVFIDAQGRPVRMGTTHPAVATTGTMLPDAWRPMVELLPVPEGAAAAVVGVIVYPREVKLEPSAGSLWIDAFRDPTKPGHGLKDAMTVGLVE